MSGLRKELTQKLNSIPDVNVNLWKDSDLLCVFYKGKEVAHFQGNNELDIRLTRAVIKREGLSPPKNTTSHLGRSKNSTWIVQGFRRSAHVDEMVRLVRIAIKQL